ncbi:MAG: InlB B-repeat-containing protein [Lachnospiraceae bacterium]|nr:InlB B-repeat-containing protein [Lachnospiraceae bacterium]
MGKTFKKKIVSCLVTVILFISMPISNAFAFEIGSERVDLENSDSIESYINYKPVVWGDKLIANWWNDTDQVDYYSLVDQNGTISSMAALSDISPSTNNNTDSILHQELSNGNLLIYWYSSSSGTGLTDAYFKIIDTNGDTVVDATKINSEAGELNRYTNFAELSNGDLAFTWVTSGINSALRRFSVSGSAATPVDENQISLTSLSDTVGKSQYDCKIAANQNGRFMIITSCNDVNYRGMIFENASPTPVQVDGANYFVISNRGEADTLCYIKTLSNNDFLTVYRKYSGGSATENRSIAYKVYGDDGSQRDNEVVIRQIHSWGYIDEPAVVDNGFILSYTYNDNVSPESYFEYYGNTDYTASSPTNYLLSLPTLSGDYPVYLCFVDIDGDLSFYINEDDGDGYDTYLLRTSTTPASATVVPTSALTEENLDTNSLVINLTGTTFVDSTLNKANFTLNNAPAGVEIESVSYSDDTHCTIELAFDGTDFDEDVTNFSVTIGGAEVMTSSSLTTDTLTITAVIETPPADVEITGFDAIANVDAGIAGIAAYADATEVIASLPTTVTANTNAVTVPVDTWVDTDSYNQAVAGSYTFIATLEAIPAGYANSGGYTATVVVVVAAPTYGVTYNGNGSTGGAVPTDGTSYHTTDTVTVLGNTGTLVKTNSTFSGWNTLANGSGTDYAPSATFSMGTGNVTLYAKWTPDSTYSVTYDANGSTGGTIPTDGTNYHTTDTVTVLGNTGTLVKVNHTFAGWNTAANGSGTDYAPSATFSMGTGNVTLYAQWTPDSTYSVTYDANGSTGGAVPTDGTSYHTTDTVTVLGNTGTLVKTNSTFAGWNTLANGSGTDYAPSATFSMGTGNVTLYAKWNVAVSSDATLKASSTVKGQTVTSLGTPNATLGSETAGAVTITAAQAADTSNGDGFVTLFDKNDTNATVKAVKYGSGTTDFSGFDAAAAYTIAAITDGDFFIVRVTAEDGTTVNYYSVNVTVTSATLAIDTANPQTGTVGTAYAGHTFTATGGTGAKSYAVTAGALPIGLSLSSNGTLSGTPMASGSFNFTVTATDSASTPVTDSQAYSMTINPAPNTAKAITAFNFNGLTPAVTGTVDEVAKTITLTVPNGTDVTALVPTITHTGISVFPDTGVAQNFTTPVSYTVTFTDSTTQDYMATVSVGASSNSNLSALSISGGTLSPAFVSGTTSYTASVGNAYSSITVTPTVADGNATVKVNGLAVTSGGATGEINLSVGNNIITVVVTAQDGTTSNTYTITVTRAASSGGSGGSSGGSSSTTTTQPSQNTSQNTVVVVNGKEQNAGKETQKTEDGKSTVTVEVDNKAIESKIDDAIKNNTTGTGNVIQIPVADTKSEVAKVELTGDIVKKLEENTFDVSVKRDNVEYVIPAAEFTISKVAENLGIQEKALADIKVEVKITKLDEKVVEKYNEVAKANGAELVFPPVQFEITAKTTNIDGTTKEHSINKFSNYVERIMEIPVGVDPSKITTGIVFNSDGTYSHVPTEVYQKDGKWYAKLNSLTNSDYSVIWNPVTVKSVENHWSKEAVNDMASRLVIFNADDFEPDKAITRADFAEYIVRALGLYREGSTHENNFKDVSSTGERTIAILIANEYGIISGYADGTFRGDNQITREEAMAMYQRAMKITKLVGSDENRYQNYTDYSEVSDWATSYVKEVLSAHVFNGTTETKISPEASLTYAEAAQAVKNLLVESKLISQ